MADRIRRIKLGGVLGKKFGAVHSLAVNSAAEAVRALGVLLPGFNQFLAGSKDRGLVFAVFYGKRNITKDQLADPPSRNDILFMPIVQGSKSSGLFQTVLGIGLIAAASFFSGGALAPGGAAALFGGAAGSAWMITGAVGISLALGGVAQMIAGTQKGLSSSEAADNKPSYNFSGIKNTATQGNPVPLCYGEMVVGSAVASLSILADNQQ